MRPTIMEVDINKFKNNISEIKKHIGNKKIIPVIKANGYGTYINKRIDIINQFDIVAVAILDEAIELRKLGYKKEILILNQPSIDELKEIINNNIIIGLSSEEFLNEIINNKNKIKVHLEIETGMNRTGIQLNKLENYIKRIKESNNIEVEGIYTHLSSADYDFEYTNNQLNKFKQAVELITNEFNNIKYIHSSASNGLLNYNDEISNAVRSGIIMYGYESFKGAKNKVKIEPICTLKTKITFLKDVEENESISYSRKYITKRKMKIATIPIGYADGLRRSLFNCGEVLINGEKVKIIGTICMDSCMIDVTDIKDVKIGDIVYIWDNRKITLEDISEKTNTINYEILSTISNRVPRVFISDNKII